MNKISWHIKPFEALSAPELYKILRARAEVFIIEQNCNYLDADNYDQKTLHIWAEENGEILGYCRIFDCGIKYYEASIGRVLTTENGRGKGIGKQLISYAVQTIENRYGTPEIRISAQDYLLDFYGNFGFASTGKTYFEDHLPHTEMLRTKKNR